MNRYHHVWIGILLALSITLSIALSTNKSIWRDEAFSYLLAQQDITSIISTTAKDFTPPLYYLLLHPVVNMFGANAMGLRLLSLMPILVLQLLLTREIRHYFPKNSKFLSNLLMLLLCTHPLLLYFSVELRAYSLAMLLVYLVFMSSSTGFRNRSSIVLYITSQVALLYTHNLGMFFWVAQFVVLSVYWLARRDGRKGKTLILANCLILACYVPWMPILASQVASRSSESWFTFHPLDSLQSVYGLFAFNELSPQLPSWYVRFSQMNLLLTLIGIVYSLSDVAKKMVWSKTSVQRAKITHKTLYAASLLSSCFGLLYLYSWVSQPILYGRYVAFLCSLSFLCIFSGWKLLTSQFFKLSVILVIIYASFQTMVTSHLISGVGKSNYASLSTYGSLPLYTDSDLDIMPCLFYHQDCTYVGDADTSPVYTGINQLTIAAIDDWSEVTQSEVILIRRDAATIPKALEPRYNHIYTHDLGDGVTTTRLVLKDTKQENMQR